MFSAKIICSDLATPYQKEYAKKKGDSETKLGGQAECSDKKMGLFTLAEIKRSTRAHTVLYTTGSFKRMHKHS